MTTKNPLAKFLETYPTYQSTEKLDALRAKEYARIDDLGHVYLDYTGGGLYADSQIVEHQQILRSNVFGNPHSTNPSSKAATELVDRSRAYVLEFFNADPAEYDVIFTPNASGAFKIVGESYPFGENSKYLITFDNHNSVNGIREFARSGGAQVSYLPVTLPGMRLSKDRVKDALKQADSQASNLFSFPAQSNFSGVQHPLEYVTEARAQGWDVLLDAAAFAPTNQLDLNRISPDFVALSFYKIFGYPTGLGALILRREAMKKLQRPWFAGGTITVVSVQGDKHYFADGHAAFEDGTIDYLNIPAVEIGLRHIKNVGYETIHERVRCLVGWLVAHLSQLRHSNGVPLLKIYGPLDTELRGGTIAVNFYNKNGKPYNYEYIENEANKLGISIRTGCFCNPGAGEIALGLDKDELQDCFSRPRNDQHLSLNDFRICFNEQETGAVRISVGLVSNFSDVQRFIEFSEGFLE